MRGMPRETDTETERQIGTESGTGTEKETGVTEVVTIMEGTAIRTGEGPETSQGWVGGSVAGLKGLAATQMGSTGSTRRMCPLPEVAAL